MQQLPTPSNTQDQQHTPPSQLHRITELAGGIAAQFELVPLLERVRGHAAALLGCESDSISIVQETEGYYRKEVDQGVGCREGQTFPLTEGLTGQTLKTHGRFNLDRYAFVPVGHIDPTDPRWMSAVLGVPVTWAGRSTFDFESDGHRAVDAWHRPWAQGRE
ncbi:hypothetical protein [Arthrobacter bussei]|uniref:GAF domain-containing protein n=1 Tax=Arthrobacter bussei TaxID=2594179 RepID=A0A7X1NQM3_9MICC|nr:hypothetical protein [Arthrobacter bussei]MPY11181.1 hypothetical protein [Arthrobacter bussei]